MFLKAYDSEFRALPEGAQHAGKVSSEKAKEHLSKHISALLFEDKATGAPRKVPYKTLEEEGEDELEVSRDLCMSHLLVVSHCSSLP